MSAGDLDRPWRTVLTDGVRRIPELFSWWAVTLVVAIAAFIITGSLHRIVHREAWAMPRAPAGVTRLAYSPSGALLAIAGLDGAVEIRTVDGRGKLIRRLRSGSGPVTALVLPSEDRVAYVTALGEVRVEDVRSGRLVGSGLPETIGLPQLAEAAGTVWIAATAQESAIPFVARMPPDRETFEQINLLNPSAGPAVTLAPFNHEVSFGLADGDIREVKVIGEELLEPAAPRFGDKPGELVAAQSLDAPTRRVVLMFRDDDILELQPGNWPAAVTAEAKAWVYAAHVREQAPPVLQTELQIPDEFTGATISGGVETLVLGSSGGGGVIVGVTRTHAYTWRADDGRLLGRFDLSRLGPLRTDIIAVSNDLRRAVLFDVSGATPMVTVYALPSGIQVTSYVPQRADGVVWFDERGAPRDSPTGDAYFTRAADGFSGLVAEIQRRLGRAPRQQASRYGLGGSPGEVGPMVELSGGRTLVASSVGGAPRLSIWSDGPCQGRKLLAVAADGPERWTINSDGLICRFGPSGSARYVLSGPGPTAAAFVKAKTGVRLIAGFGDGQVLLFTLPTLKAIATYVGHTGAVRTIVLAPDGRHAAVASDDGMVEVVRAGGGPPTYGALELALAKLRPALKALESQLGARSAQLARTRPKDAWR